MKLVLLIFSLCALLSLASKRGILSDYFGRLKELCRKGDARGVEQILASKETPSREALLESFKIAHKAGNYQICRALALKLPRKYVLREMLKSMEFKSLKSILTDSGTNLSSIDEMFVDHCLRRCSGCDGVQDELKLLLQLPTLNTELISKILIGLINLEMYNIDLLRVLLGDGRFEWLFTCSYFFNQTMENLGALSVQGNYHYDMFLAEIMSSSVWPKITADWSVQAQTCFIPKLCKSGAINSLKYYLSTNKSDIQQMILCISESLVTPLAYSPVVLSMLLDADLHINLEFLVGLQTLIKTSKHILGRHPMLLENYMVLVYYLSHIKDLQAIAKFHSLAGLHQELEDYLIVTRLKFLQVKGIRCMPSDITRLIAVTYLSVSGFQ